MSQIRVSGGLVCCAADAAADIAAAMRIPVDKAIDPLTRGGYLRIVSQVRRALVGLTREAEASAMRDALVALDVDWKNLSAAAREAVFGAAREALGPVVAQTIPRIEQGFRAMAPRVMGETRASASRRFDLRIDTVLSQRDRAAERFVRQSTSLFVRDEYGTRIDAISQTARDVVARGLEEGAGRSAIAASMRDALGDRVMRSEAYWQVVAGQFTNQARVFSEVGAFADAGIEAYRFTAVLDEVTTDECRFYDGQVFSMAGATAARDRLSSLTNPDDIYNEAPWVRTGTDEAGQRVLYVERDGARQTIAVIDRSGVGTRDDRGAFSSALSGRALENATPPLPPLHANCRSTIEPANIG